MDHGTLERDVGRSKRLGPDVYPGEEELSDILVTVLECYSTMAPALDEMEKRSITFNLRFAEYLRTVARHATAIMFVTSSMRILERHQKGS